MTDQLIYPDAGQWISALQAGQKAGMVNRQNAADQQAGGLMTNGDYRGAAAALYGAGDIVGGSQVAQAGYTQQSEAQKQARLTAVQQKLAQGDYAGAYTAAGTDKDILDGLDKVAAHAKETTSTMASALQALKDPNGNWLPADVARQKYRTEIAPLLISQRQMSPDQINSFDPTPENLSAIESQVMGLDKQLTFRETMRHNRATEDGYVILPEGSKAIPKHPGAAPVDATPTAAASGAMPAAAPAGPAGAVDTDALWSAIKAQESGGLAEPGKAVGPDTPYGHALGSTQMLPQTAAAMAQKAGVAWRPDLMQSNTPEALAYQDKLGRAYLQEGLDKYNGDPAKAAMYYFGGPDENLWKDKTHAYAQAVLQRANVQPYEVASMGPTPAPPSHAGDPPGTLYGDPKPVQWQSDGKGHLINTVTGDRKIDPTAGADVAADPNLVKAIIDGRAPVPTANRAATDPKWQAAMAEAMAQDPTLDAANYATRVKTRADFATGTAAKTKTALNTALGHAGDLDSQVDALHNSPIPLANAAKNFVEGETGDPRIKTFNLTKEALMHEAMKVFSGSAGSMTEFAQLASNLNVNDSPAQQHSVIRKLVGLLASKMDALGEQYKTGMGKDLDVGQIMSPHAAEIFDRISGTGAPRAGAQPPAAPAPAAAGQPVHVRTPQEAMALPPGTVFITPDGRRKVR